MTFEGSPNGDFEIQDSAQSVVADRNLQVDGHRLRCRSKRCSPQKSRSVTSKVLAKLSGLAMVKAGH